MEYFFKRLLRNASVATGVLFGVAKKIDYKTLSRYMLRINEMQDLNSIIQETSLCLKDILNYGLFAFAVQDDDKVDVWIDPSIYKKTMGKIIKTDFGARGKLKTHPLHESREKRGNPVTFHTTDLISYVLMDGKYYAKLYILPDRRMFLYHNEIINIIVKSLGISLANLMNIKRLESAAAFDSMTNCYNRREFNRLIEHNIASAKRYNRDLSIIMLDLDHFKGVNDQFGHLIGDLVLRKVAEAIQLKIRKGDYLSRYGGEEFVLVLPDTKRTRAMELAERLKQVLYALRVKTPEGDTVKITASFGVASLRKDDDREGLIKKADDMLYKAKAAGRNRVMPQIKLLDSLTEYRSQDE